MCITTESLIKTVKSDNHQLTTDNRQLKMKYLHLIRYQNLLLLALMQLVFRLGYLELIHIPLSLFYWQYALLVLATVFIAAGGYVINDIFDQEIDQINKPAKRIVGKTITESKAYYLYAVFTLMGVICGFVLANSISHPNFAVLFVLMASLLYFYSTSLKQIPLVGNVVVAGMLAFSILIIGVFDIFPNTFDINRQQMGLAFSILLDYAKFAFLVNLVREIVKDLEDVKGDDNQGMRTLPIVFGVEKTAKLTVGLLLVALVMLGLYLYDNILVNDLYYAGLYGLIFIIAPLIFCMIQMWTAKTKEQFHLISTVLKWVIFFGILSITIITLNITHHVTS